MEYIQNKRICYCSDGIVALCEYIPELDDEVAYQSWSDPAVIDAYNFKRTESFETFKERPIRSRWRASIIRCSDKISIGFLSLSPEDELPDLAIILYAPYRGCGHGTRAFGLGTQYCVNKFGFHDLYAGCYEGNTVSAKMLRKCGFNPHPEGNVISKHYMTGKPRMQYDYVYYKRSHP